MSSPADLDTTLSDIRIGEVSHTWAKTQKIKSFHFSEIDSTNLKAKLDAFNDETLTEQMTIYFADSQTAGRGRGSNTWSTSKLGSQLLSTWSFMLQDHVLPTLSPLIGLALFRACSATWPFLNFSLKAPNDLYINDKKVAGLLIETISQADDIRLLVGLGLNVISSPEAVITSTSIIEELPKNIPLLAQDWISFLERFLFETSIAIQLAAEPMNTTVCASLMYALNKSPLLKDKFTHIDGQGNLTTAAKKTNWSEL
ncbi:MAG: biotin--[acetyl-CoA-carboxylase] ligase [Bdellovibrio sp.]|nr:biotin--[acetyl-CoA-carboxylase] ligase [Bdellovibrio sp.]